MGSGVFPTLQLPRVIVDRAAVEAAETFIKFLLDIEYFLFVAIALIFFKYTKLMNITRSNNLEPI